MPQQGGNRLCQERDHRARAWAGFGHGGAAPSLCNNSCTVYHLWATHTHTHREEEISTNNHPRLLCYTAFGVFDFSNKCCLCNRLYVLFGCISSHRKRPEENNNQKNPSEQKAYNYQWNWGFIQEQGTGIHHHHCPALSRRPQGLDLAWPLWSGLEWALSHPENHCIALITTLCNETLVPFCFPSMATFFLCPLSAFLVFFITS